MISAFDIHYVDDTATTACVCFNEWSDDISAQDLVETTSDVAPYESGMFYKRELPCIISLIEKHSVQPNTIIIDGYVWLDDKKIGLGGNLFKELGGEIPIIGVAKSRFALHSKVQEILRGNSKNPVYITAVGIDLDQAAQHIKNMDGQFRLPTLLKRADQLCRGIVV